MQNMSGKTALGLDANLGALVCYVGNVICCIGGLIYSIIVVVQDKTNKLTRFHAFQSIILTVIGIIFGFLIWLVLIVGNIIDLIIISATGIPIPIVTIIAGLIVGVIELAVLIGIIIAAIKGYQGQIFKFPIVGNMADKFSN